MTARNSLGIWQRILQYVASHIHEEPHALLRLAHELIMGRLPELPEHVTLSAQLEHLNHRVLAHAISPGGKIAILMARDDFSCGLITWSPSEGLREQGLNELWQIDTNQNHDVIFPTGSEEPLVYYVEPGDWQEDQESLVSNDRLHIRWGDYHEQITGITDISKLAAWMEESLLYITFKSDEHYTLLRYHPKTESSREPIHTYHHLLYTWFGCIDGKGARIRRHGIDTLIWHGGEITMPGPEHIIRADTICSAPGAGVWFVSLTGDRTVEYLWWSDGTETKCTENRGDNVDREGILLIRNGTNDVFIRDGFYPLRLDGHILTPGSNLHGPGAIHQKIWQFNSRIYAEIRDAFDAWIHEIKGCKVQDRTIFFEVRVVNGPNEVWVYHLSNNGKAHTAQHKLYGNYFETFSVVEHHGQPHLLGFHLIGNTLHIIRHPICG